MPRLSDFLLTGLSKAPGLTASLCEERCLAIALEGRPVSADEAVVCDDGLEDAAVVMGMMTMLGREDDVT